ncbi:MAG: response regulator, partial [Magnetovibrio sp.]|nr:response regulator [Magnetovibrio sp.]
IAMVDNAKLISAHTGELGVQMAQIHLPAVILMDLNLPGIDGFEALRRLRNDAETCDIPIIAISADAMAEDIRRGLAEGFDAYLTKPIDISRVIDHLSRAIDGSLRADVTLKN